MDALVLNAAVLFLNTRRGAVTGIALIDSTPLEVCHPARTHAYKMFKPQVGWGKS
jgi:hypothetical protein